MFFVVYFKRPNIRTLVDRDAAPIQKIQFVVHVLVYIPLTIRIAAFRTTINRERAAATSQVAQ